VRVVSLCPLRVGSIRWQLRTDAFALTIAGKATFVLRPGESPLAEDQDELDETNDVVPFKVGADILVHGHVYAPRGRIPTLLRASLCVGHFEKFIELPGDRFAISKKVPLDSAQFNDHVPELRGDERIALEHLHPAHSLLLTRLAPVHPRAILERPGNALQDIPLQCDTLVIDTDRGRCTLVWRGRVDLEQPDEEGRVVFSAESRSVEPHQPTLHLAGPRGKPERAPAVVQAFFDMPVDEDTGTLFLQSPSRGEPTLLLSPEAAPAPTAPPTLTDARLALPVPDTTLPPSVRTSGPAIPFQLPAHPEPMLLAPSQPIPRREPERTGTIALPALDSGDVQPVEPAEPAFDPASADVLIVPPDVAPAPEPPPPLDPATFPIERCAALSAELAEGATARDELLRRAELDEPSWKAVEAHWRSAIEADGRHGSARLRDAYDAAYVEAVERFRGPIGLEEYARIVIGLEQGRAAMVLEELRIHKQALLPVVRLWTKKNARDARLSMKAIEVIRAARWPHA
jgi:hypothetical protein